MPDRPAATGRILRDFGYIALPKMLGGAFTLLLNLVLLKLLSPDLYGIYFLCVSTILMGDGLLGSAIDAGVFRIAPTLRKTDAPRALAVERGALQMKLALAGVAATLLLLFAEPLGQLVFHRADCEELVYISLSALVALLLLRSVLVHSQVEQQLARYGGLELLHYGVKFGGVALALVLFEATPARVLTFFLLGPLLASGVGLLLYRRQPLWSARFHTHEIREVFGFVKWYFLTGGLGIVVNRMDVFLLTSYGHIEEVGLFSGAYVIATVPFMVASYVSIMFAPRIMPAYQQGRFYRLFVGMQALLLVAAVVIYLLASAGMEMLGPKLLPPAYQDSGQLVLILLPGTLMAMAAAPLSMLFLLFVRRRFFAIMDSTALVVLVPLYYVAIERHGAVGAAAVTSASLFLRSAIAQGFAWRLARAPFAAAQGGCS
jgi:O-antigen/teichoic acid export membrane protein